MLTSFESNRSWDNLRYHHSIEATSLTDGDVIHSLELSWAQRFDEIKICLFTLQTLDAINCCYPKLDLLVDALKATTGEPHNWWHGSELFNFLQGNKFKEISHSLLTLEESKVWATNMIHYLLPMTKDIVHALDELNEIAKEIKKFTQINGQKQLVSDGC